jgi:hypothetical protein
MMHKRKQRSEGTPTLAFSVESFAEAHDIGRNKVYEEIHSGRLRARKVDRRTISPQRMPPLGEQACRWRVRQQPDATRCRPLGCGPSGDGGVFD